MVDRNRQRRLLSIPNQSRSSFELLDLEAESGAGFLEQGYTPCQMYLGSFSTRMRYQFLKFTPVADDTVYQDFDFKRSLDGFVIRKLEDRKRIDCCHYPPKLFGIQALAQVEQESGLLDLVDDVIELFNRIVSNGAKAVYKLLGISIPLTIERSVSVTKLPIRQTYRDRQRQDRAYGLSPTRGPGMRFEPTKHPLHISITPFMRERGMVHQIRGGANV